MSKVQYVPAVGESDPFLDFLGDFATRGEAYRGLVSRGQQGCQSKPSMILLQCKNTRASFLIS